MLWRIRDAHGHSVCLTKKGWEHIVDEQKHHGGSNMGLFERVVKRSLRRPALCHSVPRTEITRQGSPTTHA